MAGTDSARAALRQAMTDRLDLDEVRTLCFDLGIAYDDLSGEIKRTRIISLIEHAERRSRGGDLVDWLRANRPDQVWFDPYSVLVIESPFHLELVRVPAGEFLMGSDGRVDSSADENEKPQHRVYLPEFFIGKHPVTVAQFAIFMRATGYQGKAIIDILGRANHPVRGVSWYDAVAFSRWLNVATDRSFRLPTEAEWEKAARGTDGRLYPWGNQAPNERLCNFDNEIGDTTSVGTYPAGTSLYGALDMAGNVWEWTSSLWGEDWKKSDFAYPYDPSDGRRENLAAPDTMLRVLRGGSFGSPASVVRCAARSKTRPANAPRRRLDYGFRVVASPSHS